MELKEYTSIHLGVPYVYLKDEKKYLCENGVVFTKEEYLNRLKGIFDRNKFVDVTFDDISVKRNGATGKERFYGVTLKQKWHTSRYRDEGYVFLLWEFKDDGEPPVIHVRAWQPDKYPDGSPMKQEDILDMNDFFIP